MRFIWLSAAIVYPLAISIFKELYKTTSAEEMYVFYVQAAVGLAVEIILICFTISGFMAHRAQKAREKNLSLKAERDEDVRKWRKEFYEDTVNIYDTQEETLKRAKDVRDNHEEKQKVIYKECKNCGTKHRIEKHNDDEKPICSSCKEDL